MSITLQSQGFVHGPPFLSYCAKIIDLDENCLEYYGLESTHGAKSFLLTRLADGCATLASVNTLSVKQLQDSGAHSLKLQRPSLQS